MRQNTEQEDAMSAETWEKHDAALQKQADDAMVEFDELDFDNLLAVINWIEKIRDPSDYNGVTIPHERIVATFRANGFEPDVNTGEAHDEDDEENSARYLIGQALLRLKGTETPSGENIYTVPQIYHKFAKEWREKFGHPAV